MVPLGVPKESREEIPGGGHRSDGCGTSIPLVGSLPHRQTHLDSRLDFFQRGCVLPVSCGVLMGYRHKVLSAVGIPIGRCRNEFDSGLFDRRSWGELYCEQPAYSPRIPHLSILWKVVGTADAWNCGDVDLLARFVLDVSQAHLSSCLNNRRRMLFASFGVMILLKALEFFPLSE